MTTDSTILVQLRPAYERCNLGCTYCAAGRRKRQSVASRLRDLRGYVAFAIVARRLESWTVDKKLFFVPWAELFTSAFYRAQAIRLINHPRTRACSFQTNLCFDLQAFLERVDQSKVMFWVTYHPGQYTPDQESLFWSNIRLLGRRGVPHSVGMVASKNRLHEIAEMKRPFDDMGTYFWVNGMKDVKYPFYSVDQRALLREIDPYCGYEVDPIASRGLPCSAGRQSVFIDGHGSLCRCPLDPQPIGRLTAHHQQLLPTDTPCRVEKCGCFIAYMNLKRDELEPLYGDTVICRLPLEMAQHATQPNHSNERHSMR